MFWRALEGSRGLDMAVAGFGMFWKKFEGSGDDKVASQRNAVESSAML